MINSLIEGLPLLKRLLAVKFNRHFPILCSLVAVSVIAGGYFRAIIEQFFPNVSISPDIFQATLYALWGAFFWFFAMASISNLRNTQWQERCMDLGNACLTIATGVFLLSILGHNLGLTSYSPWQQLLLALQDLVNHAGHNLPFMQKFRHAAADIFVVFVLSVQSLGAFITVIRPILTDKTNWDFKISRY
jgi:hypothetical protein